MILTPQAHLQAFHQEQPEHHQAFRHQEHRLALAEQLALQQLEKLLH
jgi:hypothetical protein